MSEEKKTGKSKFITKDIIGDLNDSKQEKNIPKKRPQKRQKADNNSEEEGDLSKFIEMYQTSSKKKKTEVNSESKQKLMEVLGQQFESRKTITKSFLQSLLDVETQLQADFEMLSENEKKLENLVSVFMKCIQQTCSAQKDNLKALKDIHTSYKKECEQLESKHQAETSKLADELEEDMNKLKQQLVAETKRKQFENLRRTIFNAMQNDF